MSVFEDQKKFMVAGDQTVDSFNKTQFELYVVLIQEELGELEEAWGKEDRIECLDALVDLIVVCAGAMHSLGCDPDGAWDEVIRSNMSKVDIATGKLIKRADGKILKPVTFSPPDFKPFIK